MRSCRYTLYIWAFALVLAMGRLYATPGDSLSGRYPFTYFHTEALLNLQEEWQHEDLKQSVPFILEPGSPAVWEKHFTLPCLPDDSLFLYFEGVSWHVEVTLNGYFLGAHEDPFSPWEIPLAPHWLREAGNVLVLRMATGEKRELYPDQFLGIFRPVYLLERSQRAAFRKSFLPRVPRADTVGILAPVYRGSAYIFDSLEAARNVLPLLKAGIHHIYFPFRPGRRMEAFCAQLGFHQVASLEANTLLCWVNAYDFEASSLQYVPQFWLDENGQFTRHMGCYYLWGESSDLPPVSSSYRIWLALLIFFPLLTLALVKLLSPGWVSSMWPVLFRPRIYLDSLYDTTFSNPGLLYILVFFRILLWTSFLTLSFFYLQHANQWEMLNLFKDWSLINYVFYGEYTLGQLFTRSLLLVSGLFMLEQVANWLVSVIFQIKGLGMGMLNLNTIGVYPLVWALPLPMAFTLFADDLGRQMMIPMLVGLLLFYAVRKAYLGYIGLEKLFSFSTGIKILYICGFNILPYIIWF